MWLKHRKWSQYKTSRSRLCWTVVSTIILCSLGLCRLEECHAWRQATLAVLLAGAETLDGSPNEPREPPTNAGAEVQVLAYTVNASVATLIQKKPAFAMVKTAPLRHPEPTTTDQRHFLLGCGSGFHLCRFRKPGSGMLCRSYAVVLCTPHRIPEGSLVFLPGLRKS